MNISLAITTFERYEMTIKSFEKVLDDERIDKIVVMDDFSQDGSYEKLKEYFEENEKVKVLQQPYNKNMSLNKKDAIGYSHVYSENKFTIIFDSDNELSKEYLDAIEAVGELKEDTMYLPIGAMPNFDYTKYSGLTIDKYNVKDYMHEDMFKCAMNTCNCVVPIVFYLLTFKKDDSVKCADTIHHIYNHLSWGGKLYFVPNLYYKHLVHAGSHFLSDVNYNLAKAKEIENKILEL